MPPDTYSNPEMIGTGSGSVHVNNGMNLDFDLPFGGLKASGYGREYGREGVFEYLEPQVLFLDRAAQ